MPEDGLNILPYQWTPGGQSAYDESLNKYFMGVPYSAPVVYNDGYVSGIHDITDWIESGYVDLYNKDSATSGYSYYRGLDGKIYRVNDWENINTSGLTPIDYGEIRKMLPKRDYIGGSSEDVRFKAMQRIPGFVDYISERAKAYGVDPNLVLHRIGKEGWIDQIVQRYNGLDASQQNDSFWSGLWDLPVGGFGSFGLDDAGSNLMSGKYELLDPNARWEEWDSTNEHGRPVKSIRTDDLKSAIEINAAEMAYRQKEVGRLYGKKGKDLNIWTNAAYHRGLHNEKLKDSDYVNRNYTYPDYIGQIATEKKLGGIVERFGANKIQQYFASGGGIHINPKNRGKFNALKKRTGKTTEELTHSKNPLTRKRAIFAQNAAKWSHRHADGGLLRRFDEGGDKDGDNVQLYYNPSPDDIGVNFTVAPTVEPLHVETPYTPDDFFERWYPNRMQQVQNNLMVMNRDNGRLFPNKAAGKDARPFVNSMLRNAKLVKEYTLLHPGHDDKEEYFTFPNALKDSVARAVLNNGVRARNQILGKEIKADYSDSDLRWEAFGTYGFSKPSYPHLIFYTTANPSENTIVHERTHPLRPELYTRLGKEYMISNLFTGDWYNPMEWKIRSMSNQLKVSKKGEELDKKDAGYYFSAEELNARMNAIREQQNLNPKHTVTKEDLEEIKKNASRKDREGFLDLIDDDSLLRLFNEVADASTSQEKRLHDKMGGVNSAASGGLIERYGREAVLAALKKRSK